MKILSKYLVRLHMVPFGFTLTALTGLLLLNQVAKRFGSLVGKGLPWSVIVEFFTLTIPFLLAMTIPMAVLVTVLYTFSRLASDQEVTALKAAGVSVNQLLRPVLLWSAVIGLMAFLVSDQVVPRTNHRLRTLMADIDRKKPTLAIKEQVINEVRRNKIFLRAARIDPATYRMRDVTVFDLQDQERRRVIYAESGEMAFSPNQVDLHVTLYDGVLHEIDRGDPAIFQQTEFEENLVRVEGVGNQLQRTVEDRSRGDRELGTCELQEKIRGARRDAVLAERRAAATRLNFLRSLVGLGPVTPDTAVTLPPRSFYCGTIEPLLRNPFSTPLQAQEPEQDRANGIARRFNAPARRAFENPGVTAIPQNELRTLNLRILQARTRAARNAVELHKKYAISVACIVFVLIGVPLALRFPRGGVDLVIGVSIVIFGIYYVGLIGGETLGDRLTVPPWLAMWSSDIIFAIVGLILLATGRRAATPRSATVVYRIRRRLGLAKA